ncbi:MAG: small basic family protein [bacterium]|nr:small basic family protein [bacterium]
MLLILLCLILGILIGFVVPYQIPVIAAKYVSISFLAGLDSVLGATKAGLENKFSMSVFFSGFFVNLTLAALLTWVGDMLGVEIYQAALVTFGMRIFLNLGYIRHDILHQDNSKSILEKFIRQEK